MRSSVLFLLILLSGCAKQLEVSLSTATGGLGGSIPALNGIVFREQSDSIISSAYAVPVCNTNVYARLYALKPDGTLEDNAVTSVRVQGGRYDFPTNTLANLPSANVSHQVVVEGCDQYLARPITELNSVQNITWASSLIASVANADLNKTLHQTDRPTVKNLINSISGSSVMAAYANLNSTPSLTSQFNSAFADTHTKLMASHPMIDSKAFPTMGNEGLANLFEVEAVHFDPSYTKAYEWHLNGVEQSTSASWAFTPSADSSGTQTITLFVGHDVGTFHVDRTKPFYTVTKTINISDTIPATPLNFTIPTVVNSTSIFATVSTGTSLANCSTFKYFLLKDTSGVPSASDAGFTRTCVTNNSQVEPFTLTGADGTKTIYLWTKDSAGNVSSISHSQTVMLDRVLPTLSLTGVGSVYGGGRSLTFGYAAADAHSGLATVELFLSYGGSSFAKVKDLVPTGIADSFTLPAADVADAIVRIVATDHAGNTQTITSTAFTIDSTAPGAPTFALTSAANTNNTTVSLSGSCTGITELLIGESVSASDVAGWVTCAASLSTVIPASTLGARAIKIFARDAVGNVSPATTVNLSFDNVIPTASITAHPSAQSSETTFNFQFTGTDNVTSTGSLTYECSLNSAAFSSCTSPASRTGFTTGSNTFSVRSYDQAGNVSAVATYGWDFDASQPTLTFTSVASLTPSHSNSLAPRSITVGGSGITSYKYTVIRSGACSAVDYSALSEITLSGNQTFSFTPTTDGTYQVCAIGKSSFNVWQLAGNASASPVLNIDTVAPTFSSLALAPAAFGTLTTPTVTGTTKVSSNVTLHVDSPTCVSSALSTVVAHASTGAFSLSATALSTDGAYNYYVKSTDDSGNTLCSSALPYTLDRVNPVVTLTAFNGGEFAKGSQSTNLTWTATDTNMATSPISLEYSLNNGVNWTQIATAQANSGTYAWTMPGFNSSTAKIRITAIDKTGNSFTRESAAPFTIDSTAPSLTLNTLTGGQIVKAGAAQPINWTASDANTTGNWIALSYSSDGGSTWTAITTTTNTGSYSWTVPSATTSSTFRVKVVATDRVGQVTEAASTSNFIVDDTNPTVSLTSFTGGQAVLGNSNQTITWTASDANFGATPISLELSSNSGSAWTTIASNLPNTGSYSWYTSVADANTYRVRVTATDAAGLGSTSASASNFTVSTQAPNLSQTTKASPYYSNTDTSVTFGGTCDTGYAITISGDESTTTACSSGAWSWTTASQSTDASRIYNFSQTNAVLTLTISATWVRDTVAPTVTSVMINNGNTQTPAPMVSVAVVTEAGISVRLKNAASASSSCQGLYANDSWQTQSSATTSYNHVLSSGDGAKKICVWAKDRAGNVSVISPSNGTSGVDMSTITYASGNPPQVISFSVLNDGGGAFQGTEAAYQNDPLKITWSVSDVESLDNNPVMLDYTLNGTTWTPIETSYGGLSGNPTSYSHTYYGFSAPANTFFRVRLRVRDSAGNISSEQVSPAFNTSPWTVFAGSPGRGVGASAKSALITRGQSQYNNFAMDPITGDVYMLDYPFGLKKMNGSNGLVTQLTGNGPYNMGSSGTITLSSQFDMTTARITFDKKGFLYIFTDNNNIVYNENSERVLRVNPATLAYTTYLGKGTGNTTGVSPASTFVFQSNAHTFDESNTLYFISSCTPGTRFVRGSGTTSNTVLMKVAQNADGTPGAVTRIAGNCTRGTPTSGTAALSNPFNNANDNPWSIGLAVWGNGRYIYYTDGMLNGFKIIDGISYKTTVGSSNGGMAYSPLLNQIAVAQGGISLITPSIAASDYGEVTVTSFPASGTASNCADEGTLATQVCGRLIGLMTSSSGKFFYIEGTDGSLSRLRYIDDNDRMQTLVGGQSFSGVGQKPSVAKGGFGGIYYKKSSESLPGVYPEGLYFMERYGGILGYFTSSSTVKVTGNQSGAAANFGSVLGSNDSLGALNNQNIGSLSSFQFDRNGQPWFRSSGQNLTTLDGSQTLLLRSSAISAHWPSAAEGNDPRNFSVYPYGAWQNLALKDDKKMFLIGSWRDVAAGPNYQPNSRIQIFDYENNVVKNVMGFQADGVTPQQVTPGSLKTSALNCPDNNCAIFYDQTADRLYFSEGSSLRYITDPETPANHTLIDVFTSTKGVIQNFSLSPDKKYIMYTANERLFCHAVSSAYNSAICNNNPNLHTNLGPPPGLSNIAKGPNQMTWKNDLTFYISTYQGEIYQYLLYH